MAEFTYNNTKNINISHVLFKFNYRYYLYIFYKKNFNPYLKLKIIKKLFLSSIMSWLHDLLCNLVSHYI